LILSEAARNPHFRLAEDLRGCVFQHVNKALQGVETGYWFVYFPAGN